MNEKTPAIIAFLLDVFTQKDDFGERSIKKGTTITSAIAAILLVVGFSSGFISKDSMQCMYNASQEVQEKVQDAGQE